MGAPGTTPGPWIASTEHSGRGGWRIETDASGYPNDGWVIAAELHGPDAEKNAHQISASGELYDALEGVCLVLSGMPMTGMESERRLQAGIAALALARGEKAHV